MAESLKITEIFHSVQGESTLVGLPTTFVRLTGCPLRCVYCDTTYSFNGGTRIAVDEIIETVQHNAARHVCITGGEPLVQKNVYPLMHKLVELGHVVSLETSGALDVSYVDPRVIKILDIKTPASKEEKRNRFENFKHLNAFDQVKFVICDENDYEYSKEIVKKYQLDQICEVLFSPSFEQLKPDVLVAWILKDKLKVRFQIQAHKYIWAPETVGV